MSLRDRSCFRLKDGRQPAAAVARSEDEVVSTQVIPSTTAELWFPGLISDRLACDHRGLIMLLTLIGTIGWNLPGPLMIYLQVSAQAPTAGPAHSLISTCVIRAVSCILVCFLRPVLVFQRREAVHHPQPDRCVHQDLCRPTFNISGTFAGKNVTHHLIMQMTFLNSKK